MTDQALDAVESDPLERMIGILNEEEGEAPEQSASDEPEDDEQDASEEAEEQEKPEELETIVHNGEEKHLTKAELKELAQQGFRTAGRQAALAEQRRYIEQQAIAVQQQAQFQAQFTEQLAQVKALEGQLAQWKQVNWSELAQTDPMQYMTLHHQYTEAKDAYNNQIQTLNHARAQAEQAQQQHTAQRLQMEAQAMRQAIPDWKDQARAAAEMGEVKQFLARNGFDDAEVASIIDHRHVVVARKAMLYDKLMAQGKQTVKTAPPPVAKPGSTAKPNTDSKTHRDALKRTGKGEYAAKLIERML
jgi:hypothetical protein